MSWTNSDGLYIKYGGEEVAIARGGEYAVGQGANLVYEFAINGGTLASGKGDVLSATYGVLGEATGTETGSFGVVLPKGLRITEVETFVETAFTSSGTIGSAVMSVGLKREDRTTELDHDGLLATGFTGTVGGLATAGSMITTRVGSTGAGALIGTTLANDGVIVVANTAHATHPFTAGRLIVRVRGYFPYPSA